MKTHHAVIIAVAIVLASVIVRTMPLQNDAKTEVSSNRYDFFQSNSGIIYLLDKQTGRVYSHSKGGKWNQSIEPPKVDKTLYVPVSGSLNEGKK